MDKLTWYDEDGRLYCRRGYEVALARLASYEATGLTPEECAEYAKAAKEGRVVVLPFSDSDDVEIERKGIIYKSDHWNIHLTAFAENQPTPSGKKVALFDLSEVQESMEGSTDV